MTTQTLSQDQARRPGSHSMARVLGEAAGLLAVLSAVGAWVFLDPGADPEPTAEPIVALEETATQAIPEPLPAGALPDPEPDPLPEPEPVPVSIEPIGPDPAMLSAAEKELEQVRQSLREAEEQEAALLAELEDLELRALAADRTADEARQQARRSADRRAESKANVAALRAQRDELARVVAEIEAAPRPRKALNSSQSPVARVVNGEEYHFEVRGDRVAFIDLDRLLEEAQDDARLRLRMAGPTARSISGTVGPIGSFSMDYEVGPTAIGLVSDLIGPSVAATIGMRGFEVVPARRMRGEPFDLAFSPASEFGRVIRRLNPSRTTITLWVYPDGFPMYRRLWDALHRLGFTVAARPLPEGMPIRGGPNGSKSAGQ